MKTISKDLSLRLPNSCFLSAVDKRASILIGCFLLSDMFGAGVVEGMDFGDLGSNPFSITCRPLNLGRKLPVSL